ELHRQLAQRRWRADRQRLEKVARELHLPNPSSQTGCSRLRYEGTPGSRQALLHTREGEDERKGGSAPARARGEVAALPLALSGVAVETARSRLRDFAVGRYCSGILACLITLPQSSVSSTKNCAASVRLLVTGSIRIPRVFSATSGRARISITSRLILSASAAGVCGGATMAYQVTAR